MKYRNKRFSKLIVAMAGNRADCARCNGFCGHFEGDAFIECHLCWGTGKEE